MNRIKGLWSRLRRITKINLIVGTVFAVIVAYIGVTAYFGTASQIRYASNDFPGAKKAATAFLKLSPLQRHIGYFNRGTAEAAVGDLDAAQADLESALEIAPTSAECAVRINLSYVYEQQADEVASQDPDQSQELYDRSLKTLEDAPEECQPKKSEEKQKSDQSKKRVEDKKKGEKAKEDGNDGSDSDDGSENEDSKDQDQSDGDDKSSEGDEKKSEDEGNESEGKSEREKKRDELKKRGEDSDRQQHQQGPGGNGGRSSPDKPW
jgi:tetratricopeptide (TPR) repeat protein